MERIKDTRGLPLYSNDDGALKVESSVSNVISQLNAFHGPLAGNATYTGDWEDVSNFSSVSVNVSIQQPLTLRVHFSNDLTDDIQFNIPITGSSFDFDTPPRKRYVKFSLINGAQAQTNAHLFIKYRYQPATPFTAPFNFPTFDQSTAVTVRAGVMARDQSGVYQNLTVGSQNAATSLPVTMAIDQTSIPVNQNTVIPTHSEEFTSDVPLGANGVFAPNAAEDVDNFVNTDISIWTDQDSAINGLVFSWSLDGVNWDWTETFTISANEGRNFSLAARAKYFRLSYTNGPVAQGFFRLRTSYYPVPHSVYVKNADEPIPAGRAVDVVQSILSGEKDTVTNSDRYKNLRVTDDGILRVDAGQRPSESPGRTYVTARLADQALNGSPVTAHAVTAGKTLYVTSMIISTLNSSTASAGSLHIKDGSDLLLPLLVPPQATVIGSSPASVTISHTFPEPFKFTSAVNLIAVSGTVTCSFVIVGYEQ